MTQMWKKRLNNTSWLVLTLAGVFMLFAGSSRKYNKTCKAINVEVRGAGDHFFVEEKELEGLLNATGNLPGRTIESIKLNVLEKRLENNKWIRNAELFFDNKQVLQAIVEEREPVARLFTTGGYSYYIDSGCQKLPLSDKRSARVPMFTNFPSDRTRLSRLDSTYLVEIKEVAQYINKQPFWRAQVAQVNINDDRELEMIPTVGSHTVLLGKPGDIKEKLDRLFSFYKQVWVKVGLEKYSTVDVRFTGQVVATRKNAAINGQFIDSAAARRALDELMAQQQNNGTQEFAAPAGTPGKKPLITTKEQAGGVAVSPVQKQEQPKEVSPKEVSPKPVVNKPTAAKQATDNKPAPAKTTTIVQQAGNNKAAVEKPADQKKAPKAVMKKKQ